MAQLAVELRSGVVGAVALLAISLAPWRVVMPTAEPAAAVATLGDVAAPRRLTIELPEPPAMPNAFPSWAHPDMQPWPRGMVMGVPAIDQGIVLRRAGLVDSWLSVFLAPLLPSDA